MEKLILNCDICARAETYKSETEFFQDGIMHGMRGADKDQIHCIDCINKYDLNQEELINNLNKVGLNVIVFD
tara:strand:+ start:270 stop:485 length:216 start_codon:yes stop_codon:yes gene_type:complete